ncbi:MAG: HEAT repeat domain-containing protein [Vicinamibacteria bacterium]|nr:HEAT repeat domain-containing protein [Vicinamibacteria bacterium]
MASSDRPQSLVVNLALAAAVFAAGLLVLEGGARVLAPPRKPQPVAEYIWDWQEKWDGDFYTVRSDSLGWPPWDEFNREGLRDRAHAEQPPQGVSRLAVLGDSVTFGDGLKPDETWTRGLEAALDEAGPGVEVMNVALLGWSTRQQRLAWERIARRYRPSHALLAVCLNDVPELQNNLSRPHPLLARLFRASALVRRVVGAEGREIASVEELFAAPEPERVRAGWERFFAEVRELRASVAQDGAAFGLVVFPFRFQLEPGAPPPRAQQRLLAFCAGEGIACHDLLPDLAPLGPKAFHDYDHPSVEGARLVARSLAASAVVPQPLAVRAILARRGFGGGGAPFATESPWDRRRASPGVGTRRAAAAVEARALALRLDAGAVEEQRAALWALRRVGPGASAALPELRTALRHREEVVRAETARALGALGAAARPAVDELFAQFDDPRVAPRWAAARALHAIGLRAPDDVVALARALGHADPFVRAFAAFVLGGFGPAAAPAVPQLIAALAHPEGFDRAGAATVLSRVGPAAAPAVPALAAGLTAESPDRRWKAARALGRLGEVAASAAPALERALGDADPRVRSNAARALGRLGPAARAAAAGLQRATGDAEEEVRQAAREALAQLSR